MGIRVNEGYRIIETVRIDTSLEVVMGQLETSYGMQYVTWRCTNANNYYYGHYFGNYEECRRDLFKRVLELLPEGNGGQSNAAE